MKLPKISNKRNTWKYCNPTKKMICSYVFHVSEEIKMFQAKGCTVYGTTDKNVAPLLEKLDKENTLGKQNYLLRLCQRGIVKVYK